MYDSAPNPFNPRTQIAFDLPRPGQVHLAIYNLRGVRVRTLLNGAVPAGHHAVTWDGTDDAGAAVASGVYAVSIDAEPYHARQKLVLLK
jgi:flagellar hook assembly protein FlgD